MAKLTPLVAAMAAQYDSDTRAPSAGASSSPPKSPVAHRTPRNSALALGSSNADAFPPDKLGAWSSQAGIPVWLAGATFAQEAENREAQRTPTAPPPAVAGRSPFKLSK